MQMNELVQSAILLITENLTRTVDRLENGAEEINQDELFNTLVELSQLKYVVRDAETRLNVLLTQYMRMNGEKVLEYGNLVAERKFSSSRKNWEHGVLLEAVVNKVLSSESGLVVDPTTGEVVDLTHIAKPVIDAVVGAGGDNVQINGVAPFLLNGAAATEKAREAAVADAKARANSYAKYLGVSLGRVISLTEVNAPVYNFPVMAKSATAEDATQIDLGETLLGGVALCVIRRSSR